MILSFSKYAKDAEGASAQDAVEYPSAHTVSKPTFGGIRLEFRDPVPEILLGDPALARAAIRMAPGELKYRSAVMSFAAGDVDVADFNAGAPIARGAVDLTVGMWCEIAFAGIPPRFRPPVFATTHTHLGRLEVNLLAPRWVTRADGSVRSYNVDPPGPASRATWDAFEDLLNKRFDWADPRDPIRRRLVQTPGWYMKQQRTAERAGENWVLDLRARLLDELCASVFAGQLCGRAGVLDHVQDFCLSNGLIMHDFGPEFITIGAPNAPAAKRIRLTGLLFSQDFAGQGSVLPELIAARSAEVETASARLETAWWRRARFNASRYGLCAWPDPRFSAQEWSHGPLAFPPRWIPANRLPFSLLEVRHANPTADLNADGASTPATDRRSRANAIGAGFGARPQNSSVGGRGSAGSDHADLWHDRGQFADNGRSLGSNLGPRGRGFVDGKEDREDGVTLATARPQYLSHRPEPAAFERLAGRTAPPGSRAEFLRNLRQFCNLVAPDIRVSLRILPTDTGDAGHWTSKYPAMPGTTIHIPISEGENLCLSGPSDTMANLGAYLISTGRNPTDPVTETEDDHFAGPYL